MESQISNLAAFIQNGQIEILPIDNNTSIINLDFFDFIKDHLNIFKAQELEGLSEEERYKKIIRDYKIDRELNRVK